MTFTTSTVTAALKAAVEEKGADYVYPKATHQSYTAPTCTYSEADGSPSCIVGHVVAALDPTLFEQIVEFEVANGESFGVDVLTQQHLDFGTLHDRGYPTGFEVPREVSAALNAAQSIQDQGGTWGDALVGYKRVLAGESDWSVIEEWVDRNRSRTE